MKRDRARAEGVTAIDGVARGRSEVILYTVDFFESFDIEGRSIRLA